MLRLLKYSRRQGLLSIGCSNPRMTHIRMLRLMPMRMRTIKHS